MHAKQYQHSIRTNYYNHKVIAASAQAVLIVHRALPRARTIGTEEESDVS